MHNHFGLYWGSMDGVPATYNQITFFNGNTNVGTYSGANLNALGFTTDGNQTSNQSNRYINFFASSVDEYFDRIELVATIAAFETDNHAFRLAKGDGVGGVQIDGEDIPTPTILPGLMGLGLGFWRKRRTLAVGTD
jgi:hypothetical protein